MALTKLQSFNIDPTANFTFANLTSGNANLGNAVTANYFIGNLHGTANIATIANSVDGPNVSGQVGNSLVASTVYTNAQPNITSVGTLSNLTSNGTVNFTNASNVALGAVGNVKITGGVSGQFLQTDGTGTLSWSTVTGGGGGGSSVSGGVLSAMNAQTGTTGGGWGGGTSGNGGTQGSGSEAGASGGGWLSNGTGDASCRGYGVRPNNGVGLSGPYGTNFGGFGGGAAGWGAGGGGGGYSGGGAMSDSSNVNSRNSAGGGASYYTGTLQSSSVTHTLNGYVTMQRIS